MRVSEITMPPISATAPPLRPVPAPLATTGTSFRRASLTTSATCSAVSGMTTIAGIALSAEPSYSYTIRSSGLYTT